MILIPLVKNIKVLDSHYVKKTTIPKTLKENTTPW